MSYKYYDENYELFVNSISTANMSYLLNKFLSLIPEGGKVLDAGCGTGRDSLSMKEAGYDVIAFDASIKMVEIAEKNTGLPVFKETFETIELEEDSLDGIWASASLLHVKREDMLTVYRKLHRFLKKNGILYVSYKLRNEDFSDGSREFTCYTEESFKEFIKETPFTIIALEITKDTRKGRDDELWLNVLMKK